MEEKQRLINIQNKELKKYNYNESYGIDDDQCNKNSRNFIQSMLVPIIPIRGSQSWHTHLRSFHASESNEMRNDDPRSRIIDIVISGNRFCTPEWILHHLVF